MTPDLLRAAGQLLHGRWCHSADDVPGEDDFRLLMRSAVAALDNFIGVLEGGYE